MVRFVMICLGGALGTGARFLLSTWVARTFGADFPRGTVLINLTGSFLICAIMELSVSTGALPETTRLFLTTGIMGGYTTYSSFNYETLKLGSSGAYGLAALNLALTVVGCLAAGVLGLAAGKWLGRLGVEV